jgi:hypothetical protein
MKQIFMIDKLGINLTATTSGVRGGASLRPSLLLGRLRGGEGPAAGRPD